MLAAGLHPLSPLLLLLLVLAVLLTHCRASLHIQGIFNRHEEIRLALRFFLQALHKHKQAGLVPDKQRVLYDFVRYKGLRPVVERLSTPAIQPSAKPKTRL
jgi:hypothetical protein